MERMQSRGNILITVIVVVAIAMTLFLIVPLGGRVGSSGKPPSHSSSGKLPSSFLLKSRWMVCAS
jgi:hypothetical protein